MAMLWAGERACKAKQMCRAFSIAKRKKVSNDAKLDDFWPTKEKLGNLSRSSPDSDVLKLQDRTHRFVPLPTFGEVRAPPAKSNYYLEQLEWTEFQETLEAYQSSKTNRKEKNLWEGNRWLHVCKDVQDILKFPSDQEWAHGLKDMFLEDVQKLVRDVSDGNVMQLKEKLMRYHQRGCLLEKPAKIKKDGALMAALTAWSEFAAPLIEELLTSDPRFAGIKTNTSPKQLAEIAAAVKWFDGNFTEIAQFTRIHKTTDKLNSPGKVKKDRLSRREQIDENEELRKRVMKIREDYLKCRSLFTHLETEVREFDASLEVKFQNDYIDATGNEPLRRHLKRDAEFQSAIAWYLKELMEKDQELGMWYVENLLKEHIACSSWCPDLSEEFVMNTEKMPKVSTEFRFWSERTQQFLTKDQLVKTFEFFDPESDEELVAVRDSSGAEYLEKSYNKALSDEENPDLHKAFLDHCMSGGGVGLHLTDMEHSRKFYDSWARRMPPEFIAHDNLLSHTLADCPKVTLMDPTLFLEGYTGDAGLPTRGLWTATNTPLILLRPYLLELRDLLVPENGGAFIEIAGAPGSGRSCGLNYIAGVAREKNWLTLYVPNAHRFVEALDNPIPANDREAVFYQHGYAEKFFSYLCMTEIEKLDQIPLRREYPAPDGYDPSQPQHSKFFDSDSMIKLFGDPFHVERYEHEIISSWLTKGSGKHQFYTGTSREYSTLGDMVRHGSDFARCRFPAALMYDFIEEVKLQKEFPVCIALDGVNWWDEPARGLSTPRYPDVEGFQLSMVDGFAQFLRPTAKWVRQWDAKQTRKWSTDFLGGMFKRYQGFFNKLPGEQLLNLTPKDLEFMEDTLRNVLLSEIADMNAHTTDHIITVTCDTSWLKTFRRPVRRWHTHSVVVPPYYSTSEFDVQVRNYQSQGLCQADEIAPDDLDKIEGSTGRHPKYVQRACAFF